MADQTDAESDTMGTTVNTMVTNVNTMVATGNSSVNYYNVDELPSDAKTRKRISRKIMKNIWIISLVFFLHFTAYSGLSNLQSSLHRSEGMGTTTQSVLYAAMVLSCFFIPKLMISRVGYKWTIPISMVGYTIWMAANGYAVWGTMVPAAILVGVCAAPLWTAQCTYFSKIATKYSLLNEESEMAVVTRFFGIFFFVFQLSSLVGSVISSTVLMPPGRPNENNTLTPEEAQMYCGINDCPSNNVSNPNTAQPSTKTVWTLVGIYIAIDCVALLVVCTCVDNLPKYLQDDKSKARKEAKQSAIETALHLKNKSQCLLIPLTIYSGLEQGFFGAEWNRSYVTCSLGIWMVGFVAIPGAAVNALVSFTGGHIAKYTGRLPIFIIGLCVHLATMLLLILWPLDNDKIYVFFLLAMAWQFTDGIWQPQINALYGSIFTDKPEAAFSNYRMWESVGFVVSFAYSNLLCTDIKLYVTMSMLVIGMTCYFVVEYLEKNKSKSEQKEHMAITETVLTQVTDEKPFKFTAFDNSIKEQIESSVKKGENLEKSDSYINPMHSVIEHVEATHF